MEVICADSEATEAFGSCLAGLLRDGDVVCLTGKLGSGKTVLSKGIATGLGVPPELVTSPTFAIMNVYEGRLQVRHFDLYRLQRIEELEDIGFDEYCGGSGVTLIEWAELFADCMPRQYLQITINIEENQRKLCLQGRGERYEQLCREVCAQC